LPKRLERLKITKESRYRETMDNDLDKYQKVINEALKQKKAYKRLPTPEIPKWDKNQMVIQVTNKTPFEIERGNHIFQPYETTKPFAVKKLCWKQIKAHVGLRILYIQEGV
jgi:esterase/lipase